MLRAGDPGFAGTDSETNPIKERNMSIGTILLVILILMLVGVLPIWPHAASWGYGPSGIVGTLVVILIVLFLMGRL
jgi:membrane-bound ClpP family serine protease